MQIRLRLRWLLVLAGLAPFASANDIAPSIVKIDTTYQQPSWDRPWQMESVSSRSGSGCIIEGGRILTNAHVVSDQTFVQVRRAGSPDKYVAEVEAVSHELDLALLRVKRKEFFENARELAIGSLPSIGDQVIAYGFPRGGTRVTITRGVVSRIDRQRYSHSRHENLVCQIDAAINPGSSGGPVLDARDRVIGVAFQTTDGQNIGYVVPAPVVRHFLRDLEDGRLDGAPMLPIAWQFLENESLRESLGIPAGKSGVLVNSLLPGASVLRPRDVLLGLDGHDIGNDGTIDLGSGQRIPLAYAVDRRQLGEKIDLRVLRDGKEAAFPMPLDVAKTKYQRLVPFPAYETRPSFYVYGGLVFSPLTLNYCWTWDGWDSVPFGLRRYWWESRSEDNAWRKQVVICIEILPDAVNAGYGWAEDLVVSKVNGVRIGSVRELIEALEKEGPKFHRITFEPHGYEVVLSCADARKSGPKILERYGVPADRSRDLR